MSTLKSGQLRRLSTLSLSRYSQRGSYSINHTIHIVCCIQYATCSHFENPCLYSVVHCIWTTFGEATCKSTCKIYIRLHAKSVCYVILFTSNLHHFKNVGFIHFEKNTDPKSLKHWLHFRWLFSLSNCLGIQKHCPLSIFPYIGFTDWFRDTILHSSKFRLFHPDPRLW